MATILVGALSICNGLGRILCGIIFDIAGRKNTMTLIAAITIAAPVMMILAVINQSIPLIFLAFCLAGISFGSYPTVSAAFISSFFGRKDFSINYSVSNSKMLVSACGAMAASALFSSTGSYVAPVIMMILFGIIAFGLNFTIKHSTEKKQKEDSLAV